MALGAFLHAGRVYDGSGTWQISDSASNPAFGLLADAIHLYRMPAFFLLSGFLCQFLLERYGSQQFLILRTRRLVIPFITTLLTLNVIQEWFLSDFAPMNLDYVWSVESWVGHLWFPAYLMAAVIFLWMWPRSHEQSRRPPRWGTLFEQVFLGRFCALKVYLLFIVSFVGLRVIQKALNVSYITLLGFINSTELIDYGLFFVTGLVCYFSPRLYSSYTRASLGDALVSVILGALVLLKVPEQLGASNAVVEILRQTAAFLGVGLLIGLFKKHVSMESRFSRYMADASYTIYLFHHILVIVFAWALLHVAWSPFVKFSMVVMAVLATTTCLHTCLISRVPALRLLFNGK